MNSGGERFSDGSRPPAKMGTVVCSTNFSKFLFRKRGHWNSGGITL